MANLPKQKKKKRKLQEIEKNNALAHQQSTLQPESSNHDVEIFSSPKKSLKRKHPLTLTEVTDVDDLVEEPPQKKRKSPAASFITSSPKKKEHPVKHSVSPITSTESARQISNADERVSPSTYSKIIDTLFSPMFRAFTSNYRHLRDDKENEKKENDNMELSSQRILQSTETLNDMTPDAENTSANILSREMNSDVQLEGYLAEDDIFDDENDDFQSFDSFAFIKSLPPYKMPPPALQNVLPPKAPNAPNITLVLDLDETLVHCTLEPTLDYDLTFTVNFMNFEYCVYVRKRPFFDEFMTKVSKMFEVVIFTASQQIYADKLLNILDPQRRLIHHRLFREHCICVAGNFLKDLNVLGRDLSKVVIVDNSPHVFGYQLDNGIPIETWFDDPSDRELLNLLPFLNILANADDVRPLIRNKFKLYEKVRDAQALPLSEFMFFDVSEPDSEQQQQFPNETKNDAVAMSSHENSGNNNEDSLKNPTTTTSVNGTPKKRKSKEKKSPSLIKRTARMHSTQKGTVITGSNNSNMLPKEHDVMPRRSPRCLKQSTNFKVTTRLKSRDPKQRTTKQKKEIDRFSNFKKANDSKKSQKTTTENEKTGTRDDSTNMTK